MTDDLLRTIMERDFVGYMHNGRPKKYMTQIIKGDKYKDVNI